MSSLINLLRDCALHTNDEIQMYHRDTRFGHSVVVGFEQNGPTVLDPKYTVHTTAAMEFGSLVDTLLTQNENFTKIYYVPQDVRDLTPTEKKFVNACLENNINIAHLNDDSLLAILDECGFYVSIKKTTERINKARQLQSYISERLLNANKKCLSVEQFNDAVNCVEALHTSEITKDIFADPKLICYQVALYGISNKALFDIIYIDAKNHILYPIDLKTVSYPERDFIKNSFYKYEYYRQAEMYYDLLTQIVKNYSSKENWTVADFQFLVINKDTLSPLLYRFPVRYANKQLQISKNGFVKPYYDVIQEMVWHVRNKQYMYDKNTYIQLAQRAQNEDNDFVSIDILPPLEENNDTDENDSSPVTEQTRTESHHNGPSDIPYTPADVPLDADIRFDSDTIEAFRNNLPDFNVASESIMDQIRRWSSTHLIN